MKAVGGKPSLSIFHPCSQKLQWPQRNNSHPYLWRGVAFPRGTHSHLLSFPIGMLSSSFKSIFYRIISDDISSINKTCKSRISKFGKQSSKLPHQSHYSPDWKCKIWRICRDFLIIIMGYCCPKSSAFVSFNLWRC